MSNSPIAPNSTPSVKAALTVLEQNPDYKVIKRLQSPQRYTLENDSDKRIALYLDTETTGLDSKECHIIELGIIPFEFDATGNIYRLLPAFNQLQDPGYPIPEEITQVTGITTEMVKGKQIDWSAVTELLSNAALVIAHNAAFDRPFCEANCKAFEEISWACSLREIPWKTLGLESSKLEYLAYRYGFFYDGHRASIDCEAGIKLLAQSYNSTDIHPTTDSENQIYPILKLLLETARQTTFKLWAQGAPFEQKDALKKRGYRWSAGENNQPKAWYIELSSEQLEAELDYLKTDIFQFGINNLPLTRYTAKNRYSNRAGIMISSNKDNT